MFLGAGLILLLLFPVLQKYPVFYLGLMGLLSIGQEAFQLFYKQRAPSFDDVRDLNDGLQIVVEDDGVGMGGVRTASAGSGQGLALHSTMMAVIGGTLTTESVPGRCTRIVLSLPEEQ